MSTTETRPMTVVDAATIAVENLEPIERDDKSVTYAPKADAPVWVSDLMYEYGISSGWAADKADSILRDISDLGDDASEDELSEMADGLADVYNADLFRWLQEDDNAVEAVDAAMSEFGIDTERGLLSLLSLGQYKQLSGMAYGIWHSLEQFILCERCDAEPKVNGSDLCEACAEAVESC